MPEADPGMVKEQRILKRFSLAMLNEQYYLHHWLNRRDSGDLRFLRAALARVMAGALWSSSLAFRALKGPERLARRLAQDTG